MSDNVSSNKSEKAQDGETVEPVHVIREGAVAASIWKRQSPSGFAYYDYSLSRSWKSMSSGKTGYSKNFFDRNETELLNVIKKATSWIAERQQVNSDGNAQSEVLAA